MENRVEDLVDTHTRRELEEMAHSLGIDTEGMRIKRDVADAIVRAESREAESKDEEIVEPIAEPMYEERGKTMEYESSEEGVEEVKEDEKPIPEAEVEQAEPGEPETVGVEYADEDMRGMQREVMKFRGDVENLQTTFEEKAGDLKEYSEKFQGDVDEFIAAIKEKAGAIREKAADLKEYSEKFQGDVDAFHQAVQNKAEELRA